MRRILSSAAVLLLLSACRPPDTQALHRFACQQAAAAIDLQSASQIDALRKALGLAPDIDPIGACKALGVDMAPKPAAAPAKDG